MVLHTASLFLGEAWAAGYTIFLHFAATPTPVFAMIRLLNRAGPIDTTRHC
jgi:hypothetical protein